MGSKPSKRSDKDGVVVAGKKGKGKDNAENQRNQENSEESRSYDDGSGSNHVDSSEERPSNAHGGGGGGGGGDGGVPMAASRGRAYNGYDSKESCDTAAASPNHVGNTTGILNQGNRGRYENNGNTMSRATVAGTNGDREERPFHQERVVRVPTKAVLKPPKNKNSVIAAPNDSDEEEEDA